MTASRDPAIVSAAALNSLFKPASVAVVGASTNPVKVSGRPIGLLKRAGFAGPVYPVNANAAEVQGLKAYPNMAAIPGPVELAIICVPAAQVLEAADACIAKGVKVLVIFSSGFAEVDAAGRAMQEQLRARAAAAGVRVLGPNCMGVFNFDHNFFATFASVFDAHWPLAGRVGMCGQSGAYSAFIYALAHHMGLGISRFATTGNEIDIDVAETLAYLAEDDGTDVIIASFEGCRNGPRLMAALAMAHERRKPVVAMKVGATPIGAATAAAHTGSIAGDDAVFDAVLRKYNVYRAYSIEEMLDVAYAAATVRNLPQGYRLGILSVSGGIAVMMADTAHHYGFELLPLPADAQRRIRELVPFASGLNPVDPTGQILSDLTLFDGIFEIMLEAGSFDVVTAFLGDITRNPNYAKSMLETLRAKMTAYPHLPFITSMGITDETRQALAGVPVPAYEHPVRAIRATAALAGFARGFAKAPFARPSVSVPAKPLPSGLGDDAAAVARVLAAAGIPMAGATAGETDRASAQGATLALALGVKRDPVFGVVVTAGLSGVGSSVYGDVAHRIGPIGEPEALDMLAGLKAGPHLRQSAGDTAMQQLAGAISRLSLFAQAHADEFDRISIDPVQVRHGEVLGLAATITPRAHRG